MAWLLGFGIPIAYLVLGAYLSRALYRSRVKRDLNNRWDVADTKALAVFMFLLWPGMAPIYFGVVTFRGNYKSAIERFYKHNLPESKKEKEHRLALESWEHRNRIHSLEKEAGLKPTETLKEIGPKPEQRRRGYDYDPF